jgi:hypothetical protein
MLAVLVRTHGSAQWLTALPAAPAHGGCAVALQAAGFFGFGTGKVKAAPPAPSSRPGTGRCAAPPSRHRLFPASPRRAGPLHRPLWVMTDVWLQLIAAVTGLGTYVPCHGGQCASAPLLLHKRSLAAAAAGCRVRPGTESSRSGTGKSAPSRRKGDDFVYVE